MSVKALTLLAVLAELKALTADPATKTSPTIRPILWQDPTNISSRNLFYGPGGKEHQPHGSFVFQEEDLNGTNPKIIVRDEEGSKWTVKLGSEASPETAASRLVWAVGYFANEDYFVSSLQVSGMPRRLRRGQKLIAPVGSLPRVRLKRHLEGEKRIGNWRWLENDLSGTRELNGLRALMALLNNWDLTDENNGVYCIGRGQAPGVPGCIYMVTDLGSTFGSGGLTWPLRNARGNLRTYRRSKFIMHTGPDDVDFHTPARISLFFLATPHEYFSKLKLRWIGRSVPRDDVRWLGQLLAQLSPEQIRDAFRSAGYSPQEVEGFAVVLQGRIAELEDL
ncbi:MAG TPA: hypothetical protein VGN17_18160 [Bryobacteraceae bacterium]|jgi:hypothetical protein